MERNTDIWLLPLDGSGKGRMVLGSAFNEVGARLSPDGRWLAYLSDETGISQIYVQPFPALDARFLISKSGRAEPVWSREGRRLFYRVDGLLRDVSIAPGETFRPGIPERVFDGHYQNKAVTQVRGLKCRCRIMREVVETCWSEDTEVTGFNKEQSASTEFHTPDPKADSIGLLKAVADGQP